MYVVGLTGGIASGKTTISELFASLGAAVIDTDVISRSLLDQNQQGYKQVLQKFGESILLENGEIDRRQLRSLIFNNEELKLWLESVLHPLIRKISQQKIAEINNADYVILVVPLLFESNYTSLVDRVLAVDCDKAIQVNRLTSRDNIDNELAEKMIAQQMPNENRVRLADDIIVNNGSETELITQIRNLPDRVFLRNFRL